MVSLLQVLASDRGERSCPNSIARQLERDAAPEETGPSSASLPTQLLMMPILLRYPSSAPRGARRQTWGGSNREVLAVGRVRLERYLLVVNSVSRAGGRRALHLTGLAEIGRI